MIFQCEDSILIKCKGCEDCTYFIAIPLDDYKVHIASLGYKKLDDFRKEFICGPCLCVLELLIQSAMKGDA